MSFLELGEFPTTSTTISRLGGLVLVSRFLRCARQAACYLLYYWTFVRILGSYICYRYHPFPVIIYRRSSLD